MPSKIITTPVRFSYLFARSPKVNKKGEESYGSMLIIPKTDKVLIKNIKAAIQCAFEEDRDGKNHLKTKASVLVIPANISTTLYDGDTDGESHLFATSVENCFYLNTSSNRKIDVLDRDRLPIDDSDKIYSGMFGRAILQFKAYSNESKGITCYINGIQKTGDGPRLDGTTDAAKEFDDNFDGFDDEGYEASNTTDSGPSDGGWDDI